MTNKFVFSLCTSHCTEVGYLWLDTKGFDILHELLYLVQDGNIMLSNPMDLIVTLDLYMI